MVRFGAIFAYTLFAVSWLSWFVMMAGTAAMQNQCGGYLGRSLNLKIVGGDVGGAGLVEGCDTTHVTAWIWWTVWFEFMMLILLSVAECCRVHGLYLTKQLFLAMVSTCMMFAADRANTVISTYEGALRNSARATLAGQVVTILCNLIMLLYFGGEINEMRRSSPDEKAGTDLQPPAMAGASGGVGANMYALEFERLVQAGRSISSISVPESKSAHKAAQKAAALSSESWQA